MAFKIGALAKKASLKAGAAISKLMMTHKPKKSGTLLGKLGSLEIQKQETENPKLKSLSNSKEKE